MKMPNSDLAIKLAEALQRYVVASDALGVINGQANISGKLMGSYLQETGESLNKEGQFPSWRLRLKTVESAIKKFDADVVAISVAARSTIAASELLRYVIEDVVKAGRDKGAADEADTDCQRDDKA